MDAKTSSRLRERRAHRRAQFAEKWRERVMKELERPERKIKDKEEVPQLTKELEGQTRSQEIGGTTKEVR